MKGVCVLLLLCAVASVFAHSWLECADFRPTVPGLWDKGECKGRPRNWGKLAADHDPERYFDNYREYRQDQAGGNVCRPDRDGPHPNPVSSGYSATDPMTVTTPGGQLCWRWPAKNHDDNKGYMSPRSRLRDHPVFVNWAPNPTNPTSGTDPSQAELLAGRIVGIDYQNCTEVGTTDRKPCGGCFNVPNDMKVGTYLVQWWWEFNPGEIYISCADIEVKAGGTPAPAPTYPAGYLGCYESVTGANKALDKSAFLWEDYPDNSKGNTNSVEVCKASCAALGKKYAGMLFSTDCYCGDTAPAESAKKNSLIDCAMSCTGDVTQLCGGNTAASVYSVTGSTSGGNPAPATASPTTAPSATSSSAATAAPTAPPTAPPAGAPTASPAPTSPTTGGAATSATIRPTSPASDINENNADSVKADDTNTSSSGTSSSTAIAVLATIVAIVSVALIATVVFYKVKGHMCGYVLRKDNASSDYQNYPRR